VHDGEETDYLLDNRGDVNIGEAIVFEVNSDNELTDVQKAVYQSGNEVVGKNVSDYEFVGGEVEKRDGNYITVEGKGTYRVDSQTLIYDGTGDDVLDDIEEARLSDVKVGKNVGLVVDGKVVKILYITKDVPSGRSVDDEEEITGVVTYIDTTNRVIYVDNVPYTCGDNTKLLTPKGSIIAIGFANIGGTPGTPGTPGVLAVDDEVKDIVLKNGVIDTFVATKVASIQATVTPVDTQIEALPAVDATDTVILGAASNITAAKTAYDALTPAQKALVKPANVTKLNTLVAKLTQLQDEQAVAADKAALTIPGDLNNVTADLTLATTGTNGSTITWASSNTAIVKADGTVTRPYGANVQVTLTATITKGTASDTKVFIVTVIGQ
jgi:hypothetical protein